MRLSELLSAIEYEGTPADREITDVVSDSRKIGRGSLFVCLRGQRFDGHDAAEQALRNGAAAVVTERRLGLSGEIVVPDARKANALLCGAFFGFPGREMKLIGVTGTNGKTTVASIIRQALTILGHPSGLIGTIRCELPGEEIPARFTTPEPWGLHALLRGMADAGCEYAVMEASSQGLAQQRLYGLHFAAAVFTNLSQDHLDYHGTMEAYYLAKKMLFGMADTAVVNAGDPFGQRLVKELPVPAVTYSDAGTGADFTAGDPVFGIGGVRFSVSGNGLLSEVKLPIPGGYTVCNALAAAAALTAAGIGQEAACRAVSGIRGVPGRCELIRRGDYAVLLDFAHTADALRQLLSSLRPHVGGRLIVLFGAAGDRDAGKRPDMAGAVADYADYAVVTSDNPRTEDPDEIIAPLAGVLRRRGTLFFAESDRKKAVLHALRAMRPGDLLALCGKGHEEYQVLNGVTVSLSERRIVEDYFGRGSESSPG